MSFGGHACTEALQEALRLPLEAAEHMKKRGSDEGADSPDVDRVLQASTETLVDEIRKTLDFFRSTTGAAAIDRLFVCGGGSLLAGLLDRLRQRLDIRTIPLDPFRLLGGAPLDDAAGGGTNRRVAAVAVGLALRREDRR